MMNTNKLLIGITVILLGVVAWSALFPMVILPALGIEISLLGHAFAGMIFGTVWSIIVWACIAVFE